MSTFIRPEISTLGTDSIDIAAYEEKYGDYAGVFLDIESVTEHFGTKEDHASFTGPWTYLDMFHQKYIVLDPESDRLTSLRLGAKPDSLYMIVTEPDGTVRRYDKGDLEKEKVNDDRDRWTFVYPDIVKGTIIEEGWEYTYPGQFMGTIDEEHALQFTVPVERLKVAFACPEWWRLKVKYSRPGYGPPVVWNHDMETKKTILSYEATDIPGIRWEPYSPEFKEMADYLTFHVTHLEMSGVSWTRDVGWQDMCDRIIENALKHSFKPRPEVTAAVNGLIQPDMTDYEKMETIITNIQENYEVTYDGKNGKLWKVIEDKEGSGADLCALARMMLKAAGIEAWIIMAHSAEDGYFDRDFFSGEQLRAMAVRAQLDSTDYVVFPYTRFLPVNHIPSEYLGQPALVLDKEIATFWTIPEGNRADNTYGQEFHVELGVDGGVRVREKIVAGGFEAYKMRTTLDLFDEKRTEEYLQDLLAYTEGEVVIDSYFVENAENTQLPIELELYYTIDNQVLVTPEEVIFQTGGLFSPVANLEKEEHPGDRQNPIQIDFDSRYTKEITITYPESWILATELTDNEVTNQLGTSRGSYRVATNQLVVNQQLDLNRARAERTFWPQLQALFGEKSQLQIPTLVFSVKEPEMGAEGEDKAQSQ